MNKKEKQYRRYFNRNIRQSLFLTFLFFVINIVLVLAFLLIAGMFVGQGPYAKMPKLGDVLEERDHDGNYSEKLIEEMRQNGTFIMEIDENGKIGASVNLPEELNHDYSRSQIASFTRWYLDDHMVLSRVLDDGTILVYGYPKGKGLRYNLIGDYNTFMQSFLILPFLLVMNLVLFLFLQWHREKKLEDAIVPVLDEVHRLSKGEAINLPERGPLSDVNRELNETSLRLSGREASRVEWITGISHDVRTPLAVIRGSAELLQEGQSPEETEKAVKKIESSALRIESLVTSLSLNSKLDYGYIPAKKRMYDAASLFRDILAGYLNEHALDDYPLDIRISEETEHFEVEADPDLMTRLVFNLLDNVRNHNPEGCRISIELNEDRVKEAILFEVRDYGKGVDEATLRRINEPVKTADYGYHKHGLGLLIVKKIIYNHNAQFLFGNADPGFRVRVWFPSNTERKKQFTIREKR